MIYGISDVFPTCSDLYWFMRGKRVESEDMVSNGQYTISPGGADGVKPFKVTCKFPKTEIPITPGLSCQLYIYICRLYC